MRTRGFTLVQLLVVVAALMILAYVLFPIFAAPQPNRRGGCQSNLKQIMLGMMAYVQDNNERYPLTRGTGVRSDPGFGWAGSIQSYLKSIQILHCPTKQDQRYRTPQPDTGISGYTDYYYNRRLAKFSEEKMNYVSNTIALTDGNDDLDLTDAAYSKPALPPSWIADTSKPTYRHLGGANYAFCDGHVKWLKPTVLTNGAVSSSVFTFAVK